MNDYNIVKPDHYKSSHMPPCDQYWTIIKVAGIPFVHVYNAPLHNSWAKLESWWKDYVNQKEYGQKWCTLWT